MFTGNQKKAAGKGILLHTISAIRILRRYLLEISLIWLTLWRCFTGVSGELQRVYEVRRKARPSCVFLLIRPPTDGYPPRYHSSGIMHRRSEEITTYASGPLWLTVDPRQEFRKNLNVDKKDFTAIEYLLRRGRRQLGIYASPGIRNIL